ncbi:hypothetical protein GPALN_015070 [Globodera pallida]|nr:hypothetical protein GPALN_015070 [Globodera pallida]
MDRPVPLAINEECGEVQPKILAPLQNSYWACVLDICAATKMVELCTSGVKKAKRGDTCKKCSKPLPLEALLHHTNVVHLNLSLYMCPVCTKKFPYVIYGIGHCKHHFRVHHANMVTPSNEAFLLQDFEEKMMKIVNKTIEHFLKSSN